MVNPIQLFFEDTKQTLILIIFVVLTIFVLASFGVAFGMQEFTNSLISSMSLGVILILAIPPIGLIIAIFIFLKKSLNNSVGI